MFVDLELARRLEHTEGMVGASFVEARPPDSPIRAAWRDFDGVAAIFDGIDSPMSQTFGLGMHRVPSDSDLVAIEAFFTERGADTMHEVSPFAGIETLALLVARGYQPIELSNVLVQPIGEPRPVALATRVIDPVVDGKVWTEVAITGWGSDPVIAAFIRDLAEINLRNDRMMHYLVELDGAPIATASLGVHDDIALLAGASTVPAARGRGAQAALLAARLADAHRRGCTTAMMAANVGSTSQRNAERNGFRVGYTRTKWRRSK